MERYIKVFIEEGLKDKKINTIEAYKRDIDNFVLYISGKGIHDIEKLSDVDVMMYFINLEKTGKSRNSIVRYVAVIRTFFEFLYKKGIFINKIDFEKYKPKVEKIERGIISKNEFERLLNSINIEKNIGLRDKIIILFMYYYGLKPTSLVEIKLMDVDLNLGIVTINNKRISINKEIVPLIKAYVMLSRKEIMKENYSEYLFTGYGEVRLTRQSVWKIVNKYRKMAKIDTEITSNVLYDSQRYHRLER
ncbi:MAG TPA: hypothetical protein DCP90_00340 [Clostridiales bacterium]|nr:MAG: hypothetical protein A2Y22_04535 [Clostridiales bacterium GWD2_32_59]HAN09044.1 hypothetical protein [Clostridiales bacterium]